jgi:pimeloyl-ACP methyl ester carboxylesterase
MNLLRFSSAIAVGLLVTGCLAPVRVDQFKPPVPAQPEVVATHAAAARKADGSAAAAGRRLDAISACLESIERGDAAAQASYNHEVARLIEQLEQSELDPFTAPVLVQGAERTYTLHARMPHALDARDHLFIPADSVRFSGRYASQPVTSDGIGAPLVAKVSARGAHANAFNYRSLTAIVRVRGNRADLTLEDPFETQRVSMGTGRKTFLMAADYTSSIFYALSVERIDKLGIARLLNPSRYDETARLVRLQPYDPNRIPVLMVHGLQDSPATWMPMYHGLISDPEIRARYQFWVFSYPSGYPYPYTAALFRRELARIRHEFPQHQDIVLLGHSMGGILSRMMVSNSGNRIWLRYFGKPPEQVPIRPQSRELMEELAIFQPQPKIARAIFCSAPHRGSELANNWIGRLGSRLIRVPSLIADLRDATISALAMDANAMTLDRAPNSIDTLSPNNRFVQASKDLPIPASIPYHSIIGDRGKGDTPNSSDGVVAYWSSHMPGAVSEKIVPSNHSSHQHPEAIEEVRRILKQHRMGRAGKQG